MIMRIFDIIGDMIKPSDVFWDFGAGDGRVVMQASRYCNAFGIEKRKDLVEYFQSRELPDTGNACNVIEGDFMTEKVEDATIAFMNLVTMPELIRLTGRITQSCPDLRMMILARQLPQFEKKLIATVEPPRLQGHMMVFFGKWDIIKDCTLHDMRMDSHRNIYGEVKSMEQDADEHFYIYKIR